jgi:alpha-L-fucosidase
VSKNGNLLLNVGPEADGTIPAPQAARLKAFGAWLRTNGEAVYGAHTWTEAEAVTADGLAVRFTQKNCSVYLIVLGAPAGHEIRVRGVSLEGQGRLLADGSPVALRHEGTDTVLGFSSPLKGDFAPSIAFDPPTSVS